MATIPEKISIKRRREDEPSQILVLEKNKKQKVGEAIFLRVPEEVLDPKAITKPSQIRRQDSSDALRRNIPLVKITKPGQEDVEFAAYKASLNKELQTTTLNASSAPSSASSAPKSDDAVISLTRFVSIKQQGKLRSYHLSRELPSTLRPRRDAGIRKRKSWIRPVLATFVERTGGGKPKTLSNRTGNTLHQDQDSNVHESMQSSDDDVDYDELADELTALALAIEPVDGAKVPSVRKKSFVPKQKIPASETDYVDDFVYETYIKVAADKQDTMEISNRGKLGLLVIDEEEEELWDQYLHENDSDSDEWDEEDADSNAEENPRNDYPDDELSSGDEHDRDPYRYYSNHFDEDRYDTDE